MRRGRGRAPSPGGREDNGLSKRTPFWTTASPHDAFSTPLERRRCPQSVYKSDCGDNFLTCLDILDGPAIRNANRGDSRESVREQTRLDVLSHHLKCEMKRPHLVDFSRDFVDFQSNSSQSLADFLPILAEFSRD